MAEGGFHYKSTNDLTVDDKGRITIPTRYRDDLRAQCDFKVTLTRSPEGCLMLFPRAVWAVHEREIANWSARAKVEKMIYLGSAEDLEIDNNARLLIPAALRRKAAIEKEALLVGMGKYFEIWDPTRQDAYENTERQTPDEVQNYVF